MFDIHIPVMTVRIDLPSGIYRYHIHDGTVQYRYLVEQCGPGDRTV